MAGAGRPPTAGSALQGRNADPSPPAQPPPGSSPRRIRVRAAGGFVAVDVGHHRLRQPDRPSSACSRSVCTPCATTTTVRTIPSSRGALEQPGHLGLGDVQGRRYRTVAGPARGRGARPWSSAAPVCRRIRRPAASRLTWERPSLCQGLPFYPDRPVHTQSGRHWAGGIRAPSGATGTGCRPPTLPPVGALSSSSGPRLEGPSPGPRPPGSPRARRDQASWAAPRAETSATSATSTSAADQVGLDLHQQSRTRWHPRRPATRKAVGRRTRSRRRRHRSGGRRPRRPPGQRGRGGRRSGRMIAVSSRSQCGAPSPVNAGTRVTPHRGRHRGRERHQIGDLLA